MLVRALITGPVFFRSYGKVSQRATPTPHAPTLLESHLSLPPFRSSSAKMANTHGFR